MLRQTEIQAYFLLVPGEGGCLFYAVSAEVSGGQKWELSCALGCRRAEQLDVVCCVDLCGYGFRLQVRRGVRKGCPQAPTAPRWYLPRKVRNREQHAVNGNPGAPRRKRRTLTHHVEAGPVLPPPPDSVAAALGDPAAAATLAAETLRARIRSN